MAGMGCPNTGCKGYELVADLDFDTNEDGSVGAGDDFWNDGAGWEPVRSISASWYGAVFEGNSHVIARLYINRPVEQFVGLFGGLSGGAQIRRLALTEIAVTGSHDGGTALTGGLVGDNEGIISDSYATGSVTNSADGSYASTGGLVGDNEGTISDSYAHVLVINSGNGGYASTGGLVGINRGAINHSYATGSVTNSGDGDYISSTGGLVGDNEGTISDSYASGSVANSGNGDRASTGGLVGDSSGAINGSYATGSVSNSGNGDDGFTGGLVGDHFGAISDSYATGSVTNSGSGLRAFTGGLVGNNLTAISASRASGPVTNTGGGSRAFTGGLVGNNLGGSISISSATGSVINSGDGDYASTGGLVGDDSGAISGSYATGSVTNSGNGVSPDTGGLAGYSYYGQISASYATGSVTNSGDGAYASTGGLVGYTQYGQISSSYASGSVTNSSGGYRAHTGGLVGQGGKHTINASYASGLVTNSGGGSDAFTGGLVGHSSGDMSNITDSYWDTETSGQAESHGGVGKTTSELQSPTGYTGIYARWNLDLNGDAAPDDPWFFGTASSYPVLYAAPAAPVLGVEPGYRSATLTWESMAADTRIAKFQYQYVSSDGGAKFAWADLPNSSRHTTVHYISDLEPGKYTFRVRAVDQNGNNGPTARVRAIVPETMTLTGESRDKRATLSWEGYDGDFTTFQYRHRTGASNSYDMEWKNVPKRAGYAKSFTVKSLANGYGYTFQIRTQKRGITVELSNEWTAWPADTTPPKIKSVAIESTPKGGDVYSAGETIVVLMIFDEEILVLPFDREQSHVAELEVRVGKSMRVFTCNAHEPEPESGINSLACEYQVVADDLDSDGISIGRNRLKLHDAIIWDYSGNFGNLAHKPLARSGQYKVDGSGS